MSRIPRRHSSSAIFHIINRGNHRANIFDTENDYLDFIEILGKTKRNFPFLLHAFCLMPNHFHLLMQRLTVPLSKVMQIVQGTYGMRLNKRRQQTGHVFQDRFKDSPCESDRYYKILVRYIHENPLRAGLTTSFEQWNWSSHDAYKTPHGATHGIVDTSVGLTILGKNESEARQNYAALISTFLSTDQLDEIRDSLSKPQRTHSGDSACQYSQASKTLKMLADSFCSGSNLQLAELTGDSRSRALTAIRREFARKAISHGFNCSDIAKLLNRSGSAIFRLL